MKKKILALALAVIMIISLLPITALAADTPMPKVTVKGNGKASIHSGGLTGKADSILFIQTVDGRLVKVAEEPADNYMKFFYNKTENVLEILFKNIDYRTTVAESALLTIGANSNYTGYFDVEITLEGTNVIESTSTGNELSIGNLGTCTITGSGSLRFVSSLGSGAPINRNKTNSGELIIKDTTLYLENTYTSASTAVIVNNNKVTIENSDVTVNGGLKNRGIVTSTKFNETPTNAEYGVTVKDSDFTYVATGAAYGIWTVGPIVFDNSNIQMDRGEQNNSNLFNRAPQLIGNYSEVSWRDFATKDGVEQKWLPYADLGLEPGDVLDAEAKLRHFKAVVAESGEEPEVPTDPSEPEEEECLHENADEQIDCTEEVICPDCEEVVYPAKEHAFNEKASDFLANEATCDKAAEYYVQCDNCDEVSEDKTVSVGEAAGHIFNEKASAELANEATCDKAAEYYVQCDKCDEVSEDKTVSVGEAAGHVFNEKASEYLANEATCDKAAEYYVQCDNCDEITEDKTVSVGEAAGHVFNEKPSTQLVEGTTGTYYVQCDNCDAVSDTKTVVVEPEEPECTHENAPAQEFCDVAVICPDCEEEVYAAKEHTPGAEADCENDQICTVCEKVLNEKTNHAFNEKASSAIAEEATCTTAAKYYVQCDNCDAIDETKTVEVGTAKDHSYEADVVEATFYQKGYTTYTCACGDSYTGNEVARLHYAAQIGDVRYATLQDAIDEANAGDEIDLVGDVTYGATIIVDKKITIDFNGYRFAVSEVKNGAALYVTANGELKLISTGEAGELHARYDSYEDFTGVVINEGVLSVENVILNGNNLFVEGAATIINKNILTLGEGAELNVNYNTKIALVNTKEVSAENVKVNAPKGYFWNVAEAGKFYAVAVNGDKLYTSLQAAIDDAAKGDEVVLTENVNNAATLIVAEGKELTINLGGFNYAVKDVAEGAALVVGKDAVVTLTNGKLEAMYASYDQFDCVVKNAGALTVKDATLNGNNLFADGAAAIVNNGALTLEGATIQVKKAAEVVGNPAN